MTAKRILAYGEDVFVISTRAMTLQRAGYEVAHTTCATDVAPLLRGIFFDMLLIGDSLRTPQNVRLVQLLRQQFPTLIIAMVQDEKEERDPWSTAFVSSNPEQMLSSIHLLLEKNRKPAASSSAKRDFRAMYNAAGR
jgi:hypothetical protein